MRSRKKTISKSRVNNYATVVAELKERIRIARLSATRSVNRELIKLYFDIGKIIVLRQNKFGWGKSIVEKLAHDLRIEFPEQKGFSSRNLWEMRLFYETYGENSKLQQLVAELPWGHNLTILHSVADPKEREYYLRAAASYGWSRAILMHQIDTNLYQRQLHTKKTHNFRRLLPAQQARMIDGMFKDPYIFDFIALEPEAKEREIELALLRHLRQFLVELGAGFAFVGSQYKLQVGTEEYFIDLLFYHLRLRRYIVVDLKTVPFKPEFAGKMNFYLTAVDEQLRHNDDKPSIGILLCKDKDDVVVEFALRDIHKPLGVARYQTTEKLPKQLAKVFPTADELKQTLKEDMAVYSVSQVETVGLDDSPSREKQIRKITYKKLKRSK